MHLQLCSLKFFFLLFVNCQVDCGLLYSVKMEEENRTTIFDVPGACPK